MARSIKSGDRVRIYMNPDSNMWLITTQAVWTVIARPRGGGDTWAFEQDDRVIEINPMSANFDGLELVEREEATNGD